MCGIVGFSGIFPPAILECAPQAIAHRCPDDSGLFVDERAEVGLGHVRLSIIDLTHLGHQPMISSDGQVVLIFNGEIYNYRMLRTELEIKGVTFKGGSDTEVLLSLYIAEGEAMLPRLNGIFTFAIWDARKQILFIARDALGVKPLYYASIGNKFAFASEIKALLQIVPEAHTLDTLALHRYLTFLWCPGEGTPLKEVRKLLPGEAMLVRAGSIVRRWAWYQLPVFRNVVANLDENDAREGTVAYLRQAVHRQMVSDAPLGAFLSGGLDSGAVVAFAREQNPSIRCFTVEMIGGQEEGMADDLPYARRLAQHLGLSLDVVTIDSARMAEDLAQMVVQLDEPLADPASLNVLYISKLARENGIKVLLSGTGGDDLFTGCRRHHAVQLEQYWRWLPQTLRQGLEHATSRFDARVPLQRRLAKLFNGAGMDDDSRMVNYFRWIGDVKLRTLYSANFLAELGNEDAAAPMLDFLAPLSKKISKLERILTLEQRFFLADHNLIYTDKMSMATGVEVRVPFIDLELIDFATRIPATCKQRGSIGKWVLKKAMEPYLPHDVIYRPKTGFGAPLRRWIRHELHEWVVDVLSSESLRLRGLFSPQVVQQLIADNFSGKIDASYTIFSLYLL